MIKPLRLCASAVKVLLQKRKGAEAIFKHYQ